MPPWTEEEKRDLVKFAGFLKDTRDRQSEDDLAETYQRLVSAEGFEFQETYHRTGSKTHHFALLLPGASWEEYEKAVDLHVKVQKMAQSSSFHFQIKVLKEDGKELLADGFKLIGRTPNDPSQ